MVKGMTGIVKVTGALAMAGGIIAMAAMPAAAAAPNEAYGSAATGPISASPIGLATYPGTSPVTVSNANVTGLLTTGTVTDTAPDQRIVDSVERQRDAEHDGQPGCHVRDVFVHVQHHHRSGVWHCCHQRRRCPRVGTTDDHAGRQPGEEHHDLGCRCRDADSEQTN